MGGGQKFLGGKRGNRFFFSGPKGGPEFFECQRAEDQIFFLKVFAPLGHFFLKYIIPNCLLFFMHAN